MSFLAVAVLLASLAALDGERGIALYREKRFAEAEKELRKARTTEARLYLARTLIELGRISEGLAEVEQALATDKSPDAAFQAGRIVRDLAERRFAELTRIAPNSAAIRELAGLQFERKGQLAEALAEFERAASMEPRRPGVNYRIGNVLWRMRELERADAHFRRELDVNPHHAMANLRLGQVLIGQNEEERAMPFLERAVNAAPGSIDARRELGKVYRKTGRYEDARKVWEAVAEARPQDDQIHYLLGTLYRQMGEEKLVGEALERHRAILERRRVLAEKQHD